MIGVTRARSSAGERFPDTEEVTGSNPVAPTTVLPGQRPISTWRTALPTRRGRAAAASCSPPNRVGRPELDDMGQPSPNDHAGWSPPPGPSPWSAPRRRPAQDALRRPVSTCSIPGSPTTRPAPRPGPAPVSARRPGRAPAGTPAKQPALGYGHPPASQHGQRRTIPSRPARCRQATTPAADHGDTSTHCAQPEGGPPHRATPGPARRGQRGGSAADTGGLSVRTPGCTGRLDTGRLDAGRPLDRLDGRPHGGTGDADRATTGLTGVRTVTAPAPRPDRRSHWTAAQHRSA
jgi:hypothetical protein